MPARILHSLLLTLITIASPGLAADHAPPPDPLHNLTESEKRTLVLAALEKRQSAIANLHYTLKEEITNIHPDGARQPMGYDHHEFRLHPVGGWLHHIDYNRDGKLRSEWFLNRTRTESRGLSRDGEDRPWVGSIRAGEDPAWRNC